MQGSFADRCLNKFLERMGGETRPSDEALEALHASIVQKHVELISKERENKWANTKRHPLAPSKSPV